MSTSLSAQTFVSFPSKLDERKARLPDTHVAEISFSYNLGPTSI